MSEVTLISPRKITSTDNSLNLGFKRRNDLISQTDGNTGLNLFNKRSILNVGMLLTEGKVAKEVRSRLLDIEYESSRAVQETR